MKKSCVQEEELAVPEVTKPEDDPPKAQADKTMWFFEYVLKCR